MSYELNFTSYEFKFTSYKFKSTGYEFKSTSYKFKYTTYELKSQVMSSNPRDTVQIHEFKNHLINENSSN